MAAPKTHASVGFVNVYKRTRNFKKKHEKKVLIQSKFVCNNSRISAFLSGNSYKTIALNEIVFASRRVNEGVGLFRAGDAHLFGVPVEKCAGETLGDAAEEEGFADRAFVFEAGVGRGATFAGGDPLVDGGVGLVDAGAWWRDLIFGGFGIDARMVAVEACDQDAFIADVHDAFVIFAACEETVIGFA